MAEVVKLVIRRSLFVNPCSSVLEQHNELKRAAGCQRVNADLGCKALQELKRTRNVQRPTRSTDAVKKIPECRAAHIRPHITFPPLKDQP